MNYHAHGFVDGGFLRKIGEKLSEPFPDPRFLLRKIIKNPLVIDWASGEILSLTRVIYYDARPDDDTKIDDTVAGYWEKIELEHDTELGFGSMRGGTRTRPARQKGVDTLIAVDMLVGAFNKIFSVAILVAGDADFVPVINEVRRLGVMVVVAAHDETRISDDLKRSADRFLNISPEWIRSL